MARQARIAFVVGALSAVSTVASTAALAQLGTIGSAAGSTTVGTAPISVLSYAERLDSRSTGLGTLAVSQRGDWTYGPVTVDTFDRVNTYSWVTFRVGPLPVEVTSLSLSYSSKIAVGGGTSANGLLAQATYRAAIFEDRGTPGFDSGDVQLPGGAVVTPDDVTWNQFRIFNGTAAGSSFILAANTNYFFRVSSEVFVSNGAIVNPQPSFTFTQEFGGTLTQPAFDGFTGVINYRTVPTTSAAGLLAAAGLLTGLRRRR